VLRQRQPGAAEQECAGAADQGQLHQQQDVEVALQEVGGRRGQPVLRQRLESRQLDRQRGQPDQHDQGGERSVVAAALAFDVLARHAAGPRQQGPRESQRPALDVDEGLHQVARDVAQREAGGVGALRATRAETVGARERGVAVQAAVRRHP